ncbi:MAG: TetR/AcrR family transcriptional regulator [Actinomycetota bacterium]
MSRSPKGRVTAGHASPRRSVSDARRVQILEAAVDVMAARGLAETRISDIAERTGTSPALVVYYFGTKDRLLAEALTYSEERFYRATSEELRGIPTATGQLRRLIELCCSADGQKVAGIGEWVLWLDMWSRAYRDRDVGRDRELLDRRWRTTIADIVRRGVDDGEFQRIDPDDFALRLAALVDGLAIQVVLKDRDVTAARMLDLCVGMAARELGFEAPPSRRRGRRAR